MTHVITRHCQLPRCRYALAEVIIHIAVGSASGTVQAARICRLCRMVMHADACSFCVLDYSVSMHGQNDQPCATLATNPQQQHHKPGYSCF